MQLITKIKSSLFFFFVLTSQLAVGQNNCPAIPTNAKWDTNCFIPASFPDPTATDRVNGKLYLPEATIANKYGQALHKCVIPNNRAHWALGIAHAWNYSRNINKNPAHPKPSYWMATALQESEWRCDQNADWGGGNVGSPVGTTWQDIWVDGCFQIEGVNDGSAYGALIQYYPLRFRAGEHPNLVGNTNFVSSTLVKAYYDIFTERIAEYRWGWDYIASVENACDPFAFEKASASSYNGGIYAFNGGAAWFNRSADGNCRWAGLPATTAGYASQIGDIMAVLEGGWFNFNGYGITTFNAGGSSFDGYYNEAITWLDVVNYMDDIDDLYFDVNFATDVTPNAQAAFVKIAGSTANTINFQDIGPVIDAVILSLPREDAMAPALSNDGSPQGPNGVNCSGNLVPFSHIEPQGPTTFCEGLSLDLFAVIDGGGGSNPTYRWREGSPSGATIGTEATLTISPTQGTYTYYLEVCNDNGCYPACCEIEVIVEDCGGCGMTVAGVPTNTPCTGMLEGTINLTIIGNASNNYQIDYTGETSNGQVSGSTTASSTLPILTGLADGIYNIIIIDLTDPTCRAFTNVTVGYDTQINEYIDASILNQSSSPTCLADLQGELVELPAPCTFRVEVSPVIYGWPFPTDTTADNNGWEAWINAIIDPSSAGAQSISNAADRSMPAEAFFTMNTGDHFDFYTQATGTPGATQNSNYRFRVYDETSTLVYSGYSDAGSATATTPYYIGRYEVTCPYTPSAYTFSWSPNLNNVVNTALTTTGETSVSNNTDKTFTVTASNNSNPTCILTDTVTVPQDPSCVSNCAPPTSITLSPTAATVCEGDDQSFTSSVTGTASLDEYYYTWYDQDNNPIAGKIGLTSSDANFDRLDLTSVTPSQDGTYTLRVEDGNNSDGSCYLEETFDLTITTQTTPTVVIEADNLTICENGNVNFSITSSDVGSSPSYSWNASNLGNSQSTTDSWSNATGFANGETVELVVSNISGCYNSTTVTSSALTINVNALPSGYSLTLPASACEGEQGLTIDIAGGNGEATDFTWSFSNATLTSDTSGLNTSQVTVDAGSGTMTVIASPNNACGSQSDIIEMLVLDQAPTASITTSGADLEYCAGINGVTLTAQNVAGASYSWTGPVTGGAQTLNNATAGSYSVDVSLNGCTATSSSVGVVEHELPTATISGSEEICDDGSESATLPISLTGNSNWSIVLNDGSGDLPAVSASSSPYNFTTSLSGNYSITSVSDANCTGTPAGSGSISFRTNLDTTNFSITCDVNDDVIIAFDITGGIPAGYDVNGISGNLSGTTWTSDPLPELTLHSGSINDGTTCHPLSLSVNKSCSCPEEVTISGDNTICDNGSTTPITLSFSGGTSYSYDILLDGNPFQTGLTTNGSSEIIQVNTPGVYTVTNFVGNCPGSTSGSATITYHDFPTATISGTTEICDDGSEDALLTIDFTGTPGFTYDITGDGATGTQSESNHPTNQASFNTTSNESFTITSLVDGNGCIARPQDLIGTADVTFRDIPDTTQMTLTCDVNDDYQIQIDLSGGDAGSYSVTGANGNLTDADTWLSDPINENTTTNLVITDQFACTPLNITTQKLCSCPAFGVISGGSELCFNSSDKATINLSLQGSGPWDVVLNNGTSDTTINGINSANISFETTTAGTYTIVSVTDMACSGTGIGSAPVIVHPLPTATLSGGGPICVGEDAPDITVTMTGTSPFSLDLDNAGTNNSFNPNTSTHTITAPAIGSHSVTRLEDGNGCIATDLGSPIVIDGQSTPSATLSPASLEGCENEAIGPITISLTTSGSSTFTYTDGTNNFTETTSGSSFDIINLVQGDYQLLSLNDGCEASSSDISDITSVTIYELPSGGVDPSSGGEICDDGSSTANIAITLEGNGPWNLTYTDGTTPTSTSVITSPFTFNTNTAGSYELTAISDVNCTGTPSGSKAEVQLTSIPTTEIVADPILEVCETGSISLSASGENITWFQGGVVVGTGNFLEISDLDQSGEYTVQNTGSVCDATLTASNKIEVTVFKSPAVSAGDDRYIFVGDNAELNGSSSIGSSIWTPNLALGDANSPQTLASPNDETIYTITSINGPCTSSDDMTVFVQYPVIVPSAFTPNGDGNNEAWNIAGIETYPNAVVLIFNRWGNEVFKSFGYNEPWDGRSKNGKLMPVGTYYYLIDLNSEVETNGQKASFEGSVTIVR